MNNEYGTTKTEYPNTPSNDDVISTINGLIQTCKDGQEGFQESAEAVQSSQLKSVFYELGQQRAQFTGELQGLVRELGGDPENSGSFAGAVHRGWINLKSVVTGQDDGAILNEAERGEDVAKSAYKSALEQNLPANVSSVIQTQYSAVQAAHDQVKALRDSTNNTSSSTATN
jgi:uncharacterized protein (TIGR02284 family)